MVAEELREYLTAKKSHIKILQLAAKRDFVAGAENAKRGYKFAACPHAAAKIRDLCKSMRRALTPR